MAEHAQQRDGRRDPTRGVQARHRVEAHAVRAHRQAPVRLAALTSAVCEYKNIVLYSITSWSNEYIACIGTLMLKLLQFDRQ